VSGELIGYDKLGMGGVDTLEFSPLDMLSESVSGELIGYDKLGMDGVDRPEFNSLDMLSK